MVEEQGCSIAADPDAALKDLQELRARSTTQFKDITDADPELEDMADGRMDDYDYEPSIAGDDGDGGDTGGRPDVIRFPLPGVVSSLLTHGDVERERTPRRTRRMSEEEPEPTPGSHRDEDDDDPGERRRSSQEAAQERQLRLRTLEDDQRHQRDRQQLVAKMLFSMIKDRNLTIQSKQAAGGDKSAVIIDARALYDAINKETIQSSLDKRVAIETLVIRDGLKHTNSDLRWVSSERQMADGLTKMNGRQQMSDLLRGGYVQLIYDSTFTAAKKKTQEERKEVNRVSRGTAVAMYVSTMVATKVAGATAAYSDALANAEFKVVEYVTNPEFAINVDTIKAGGETNIATITHDEQMQLGSYIRHLEAEIEKYKAEISDNLSQYVAHIDDMSLRHMQENNTRVIWVATHGERWHSDPECPTIRDRSPRELTFCQRCKEGR
eukprot:s105_g14.t1